MKDVEGIEEGFGVPLEGAMGELDVVLSALMKG